MWHWNFLFKFKLSTLRNLKTIFIFKRPLMRNNIDEHWTTIETNDRMENSVNCLLTRMCVNTIYSTSFVVRCVINTLISCHCTENDNNSFNLSSAYIAFDQLRNQCDFTCCIYFFLHNILDFSDIILLLSGLCSPCCTYLTFWFIASSYPCERGKKITKCNIAGRRISRAER